MARPDRFRKLEHEAYDAVVVGAGTGGLVAAALLATRGKRVLVVDQHYVAGGNTTVFHRPGYEFDVGLHYVGDCGPAGLLPRVLRAAGAREVEWVPMDPDGYDTLVYPDFRFRVPKGLDRYRARLAEQFPDERRGIDRYFAFVRSVGVLLTAADRPLALLRHAPSLATLARYATRPFADFLDTCTRNERLRAVMACHHGLYAQPPSRVPASLAAAITGHYADGGFFPQGGGQATSDALAEAIERHGGKILLSTQVERIVVERGAVRGVELVNKHVGRRTVRAPVVVSNADLKQTMLRLVEPGALRRRTVARTERYEMSPAIAVLYLGIARDLRAEGHPATNYFLNGGYDVEAGYRALARDEYADGSWVYVTIASLKNPTNRRLAPPGHTNLQVMALVPRSPEAWGLTADAVRAGSYGEQPAYLARKNAFARAMIAAAERVIPGLARSVAYQEVATPFTHSRYTLSTGGTSYGIAVTPEQFLWRRPGARTEIDGLYLCGASNRAMHGIAGVAMSGVLAASEVLGSRLLAEVFGPRNAAPRTSAAVGPGTLDAVREPTPALPRDAAA